MIFIMHCWYLLKICLGCSFERKNNNLIYKHFQKILGKSSGKPNKIWIDKDIKFYNRSMKSWLQDNNIKIYSTHNKGKFSLELRRIKFTSIWLHYQKMYALTR